MWTLVVLVALSQNTRYHQYTEKYKSPADPAEAVSAGFFGGPGHEWLAGGGFQPDGTVVLAGTTLSPSLDPGAPVAVIGTDTTPPPEPARVPVMQKGRQRKDKKGNPMWEMPSWRHGNVTGFVIRTSPDLGRILSVHRLPWAAGGVTSAAVGPDGSIYLAGPATDAIAKLGGNVEELPVPPFEMKDFGTSHVYLARLTPDASRAVWVRHMKGPSNAPKVVVTADGRLRFTGPDVRTFSTDGALLRTVTVPGGLGHLAAASPVDDTYARGGEHHSPTGREPWRCPVLKIHEADGKLKYHFYDWLGPLVGLDNLRLVSDSAIRLVTYDDAGNLILYAWSDGGNSVMTREPFDVRRQAKGFGGLGFSTWGAGVLSCAYIIKLDTRTWRVRGGTLWLAFMEDRNKPNSCWIDTLGFGGDGSVLLGGRSAWGIIRTGNAISDGEPAGPHVAVLSDTMDALRFCTTVPGGGKTEVGNRERWAIVSGTVNGRPRALFLCGAQAGEAVYDKTSPAPTYGARKGSRFGGGWSDGYALLVDLAPVKPEKKE